MNYIFLISAILTTAIGQFFYKKYAINGNIKFLIITLFLFIITPIFSFLALKKIPIDIVYVSTSLTILVVVALSKFLLNESIEKKTYLGILFIIIGVVIYGF